jgi:hypothetical protein
MTHDREVFSSYLSRYRHDVLHHPVVNGVQTAAKQYISFPFSYENLIEAVRRDKTGLFSRRRLYDVSEGFYYSRAEKAIHGYDVHGGVDIAVPYGTTVIAPFDGYAMSSYFSFPITDDSDNPRMYKGKPICFGFGYYVQLYSPSADRYVVLGHLSDISEKIPFSLPLYNLDSNRWDPTNHTVPIIEMPTNPAYVRVLQGNFIGNVGFSGLRWGYDEYRAGADRPVPLDILKYISFDEPHLHLEEFRRNQQTGVKGLTRDPYDLYMRSRRNYPTPTRVRPMGQEPLWVIGDNGLPKYAR